MFRNPIPLTATAIGVLIGAAVLAQVSPAFKDVATMAGVVVLAGLCALVGLAALASRLLGGIESSEPPRQPQASAHAHHTRAAR